jgi:DNA-binding NtrC family response regulator
LILVSTRTASSRRILIVDDERNTLDALTRFFSRRGYLVEPVGSEAQARASLERGGFDVVLTDLCLDEPTGHEGFEIIALVHDRWPATPVALLTGHGSLDVEREARRLGAQGFFSKSQRLNEIVAGVDALMGPPPAAA